MHAFQKDKARGLDNFNKRTLIFHATLLSNGFGHLLRINGPEDGSTLLGGHQIMTSWIALCHLPYMEKATVSKQFNIWNVAPHFIANRKRDTFCMRTEDAYARRLNVVKPEWKSHRDGTVSLDQFHRVFFSSKSLRFSPYCLRIYVRFFVMYARYARLHVVPSKETHTMTRIAKHSKMIIDILNP